MRAARVVAIVLTFCLWPVLSAMDYGRVIRQVSPKRLQSSVQLFSAENRVGGLSAKLEQFVRGREGLGAAGHVVRERFSIAIPDPEATAKLTSNETTFDIFPLWPNGVRTNTCDVSGILVYVGDGALERFDGLEVRDAVVVMEFDSGRNWRNAAMLGARAVLYLEPETLNRAQGEEKWSTLPLNMPRFWVPKERAGEVRAMLGKKVAISCRQDWIDAEAANYFVVLPGSDPQLRNEYILISAYADSVSVVPGISPGAEQAASAAALFEIAKVLKAQGTKRGVILLLTSGHFQALQGMRHFIENRFRDNWAATGGSPPQFCFTLDLSSKNTGVAAEAYGWWVQYRFENVERERAIARYLRERIPDISVSMRMSPAELFADAVNNPDGRHWKNHVPGRFAAEAEVCNLAGINALTFVTSDDARITQDTPFDTPHAVHFGNLATQTRTIACLMVHAANDPSDESLRGIPVVPYRGGSKPTRMSLMSGFATVSGRILTFDPRRSFLPDTSVPGALATMQAEHKSYMGVRGMSIAFAKGDDARYSFYGVPIVTNYPIAQRKHIAVLAYKLEGDGDIALAPDYAVQGQSEFSSEFMMTTTYRETPVVVFECEQIDFYGFIDPHSLKPLNDFYVLDARTDTWPRRGFYQADSSHSKLQSYSEDALVYFSLPDTRVKLVAYGPTGEVRVLLSNSSEENRIGVGFLPSEIAGESHQAGAPVAFRHLALQCAKDLHSINEWRLNALREHNVTNAGLELLQKMAGEEIQLASEALDRKEFSVAQRHAFAAWGLALTVHPKVLAETKDVLNGLLFYLALLLPFAYFAERLIFNNKTLSKQVLTSAAIFLVSFGILRLLHPAFDLTGQTMMIFIAFTMGALSLMVIVFVTGKFESGLHQLREAKSGVHSEKSTRIGLALTALAIGLASMRKRKARTTLTCATLVLVTFTVLSFTSVVTDLRFNQVAAPGQPRYMGLLLRDRAFAPLDDAAYRSLKAEFAGEGAVSRRVWFFGAEIGAQSVLAIRRGQLRSDITAMLGMDPEESKILRPQEALLEGGRWFSEGDRDVAILPQSVAEALDVRPEDVGAAVVSFGGHQFRVIGIARNVDLNNIVDLDDESMLPANFTQSQQLRQQGQAGEEAFRKFVRLDASQLAIVPAQTMAEFGADIRSIAVGFPSQKVASEAMNRIMPRTGLNLYASATGPTGPEIRRFSTVATARGRGLELVVIPVIIAALMVYTTMIASVIERKREIGIFSAVGLSPKQIASLFFAESLVYAVLGAFFGYILAQVFAVVSHATGMFSGISLNYGSLSAVLATLLVVLIVMISTIYPARVARRIATPSGSEDWDLSSPVGDSWTVRLPFTVSQSHAAGLARFYGEWFASYQDHAIGELVTADVACCAEEDEYFAKARCWLAPFDLGVQQEFSIRFRPTELKDIYDIALEIRRVSGDPEHWETLNKRFFQSLRKQFLIWRTLSADQKLPYLSPAHAQ